MILIFLTLKTQDSCLLRFSLNSLAFWLRTSTSTISQARNQCKLYASSSLIDVDGLMEICLENRTSWVQVQARKRDKTKQAHDPPAKVRSFELRQGMPYANSTWTSRRSAVPRCYRAALRNWPWDCTSSLMKLDSGCVWSGRGQVTTWQRWVFWILAGLSRRCVGAW